MLFDTSNIFIQTISNDCVTKKNISLSVLRLDKVNPIVSGNKLFKLHYFLKEAIEMSLPGIVTFGGAYSNHLIATAYACKTINLKCIGIVRGEKPRLLSSTLIACIEYGMELCFISREQYSLKDGADFLKEVAGKYKNYLIVPEGGYSLKGAAGAALIANYITADATHICTALATATTFAGLIMSEKIHQQVIGIPVLKGMNDVADRVKFLTNKTYTFKTLDGYDFGGYAKKTPTLIKFMNLLFKQHSLPTDFVYTAKMMFAVLENIEKGYFAEGSSIICIHTGGLQGNKSLPENSLIFD